MKFMWAVVILILAFFFVLPVGIERLANGTFLEAGSMQSQKVPDFNKNLFISDLHADTLLWNRDLLNGSSAGHVDLPRLKKGPIALQAFSAVTETPMFPNVKQNHRSDAGTMALSVSQRWPIKTWGSFSERAFYQAAKLKNAMAESKGQFRLILNHEDLMKFREDWQRNPGIVAGWLTVEGAQALEGDLGILDRFYTEGFRMIGPAHLFDNEWTGSQSGDEKYGLTEIGKKWVLAMNQKKMIIDLAHVSPKSFDEILNLSTRPVLISHTGIKAVCNIDRNLSDAQIKNVAAKGGLIGLGLWSEVLCGKDLSKVVQGVRHICNIVGCKYVAIGSDWDGFVTTAMDAGHIGWLTQALVDGGFNNYEIQQIMGENTFRFLLENLP